MFSLCVAFAGQTKPIETRTHQAIPDREHSVETCLDLVKVLVPYLTSQREDLCLSEDLFAVSSLTYSSLILLLKNKAK